LFVKAWWLESHLSKKLGGLGDTKSHCSMIPPKTVLPEVNLTFPIMKVPKFLPIS
jgi:hypothetical protein